MNLEKYNKQDPLYEHRELSQKWADSLHGQVVYVASKGPGVAISCINPGGWGFIKVIYQEAPSGYQSYEIINGNHYLASRYNWAYYRDYVKEMPVSQAILHRLKGDYIGELLGHVR